MVDVVVKKFAVALLVPFKWLTQRRFFAPYERRKVGRLAVLNVKRNNMLSADKKTNRGLVW